MKSFCILSVTVLALAVSHALAQAPNAAAILKSCGMSPPGSNDYENCYSYINGLLPAFWSIRQPKTREAQYVFLIV